MLGAWMRTLGRYLFDPIEERGRTLPINRFDLILSCVLALALMAAIAYFSEPWNPHNRYRYLADVVIIGSILLFSRNRRIISGLAVAFVTMRLVVGGLILRAGTHFLLFLVLTIVGGTVAWWLLRTGMR
jgi:hypothetical protein